MKQSIQWQTTLDHTKVSVGNDTNPILIDFFNPQ